MRIGLAFMRQAGANTASLMSLAATVKPFRLHLAECQVRLWSLSWCFTRVRRDSQTIIGRLSLGDLSAGGELRGSVKPLAHYG